jgi:hypothetical protein
LALNASSGCPGASAIVVLTLPGRVLALKRAISRLPARTGGPNPPALRPALRPPGELPAAARLEDLAPVVCPHPVLPPGPLPAHPAERLDDRPLVAEGARRGLLHDADSCPGHTGWCYGNCARRCRHKPRGYRAAPQVAAIKMAGVAAASRSDRTLQRLLALPGDLWLDVCGDEIDRDDG